jgi:hypothetical protein
MERFAGKSPGPGGILGAFLPKQAIITRFIFGLGFRVAF